MRKFLVIGIALLLGACASAISGQSPASRVYAAQADYNVLLSAAVRYVELPRCEQPAAPALCSKASVVAEIRKADAAAAAAMTAARDFVRAPGATEAGASKYLSAALQAIGALRTILATYGVT